MIQASLNFAGALLGALYLYRKGAVPSVISNIAWAMLTIVGLFVGA